MIGPLSQTVILFVAILKISTGEAEITDDDIGTLFFESSLQKSGQRKFACPGESVSYSCATNGVQLAWMVDGATVVTFSSTEGRPGSGFACEGEICGEDLACFVISGVLNRIIDNPTRANISYCYSTLIVIPGILDDKTAELMACPQDNYRPLNVTCEVIGHRNTSEITLMQAPQLFQIAGVPGMPDSQSSICYYYRSNSSVTVQIGMPNSLNTDLDYYKAELFRDGSLLGTNLIKLPNIRNGTEDPTTTIFDLASDSTTIGNTDGYYVNLTVFDKCNQHSPQPSTIVCDLKGIASQEAELLCGLVLCMIEITVIIMLTVD